MYLLLPLSIVGVVSGHISSLRSASSVHQNGITTITPSGSHHPVTVTAQYQSIPSYVPSASTYGHYLWVSTIITDVDGNQCTVTKTEEPITIRHIKITITHTPTSLRLPYATSTGTPYNNNTVLGNRTQIWKELYEMIGETEFQYLGPEALQGYPGSGLCDKKCHGSDDMIYQPAHIKEFKHGKWSYYNTTYTYGAPTPISTSYGNPGTYTIPAFDVTMHTTMTVPSEATYTASAGSTVTYGGLTTSVSEPCSITARYGVYGTKGDSTKILTKTTTIYADKPGYYTIVQPTVTRYEEDTECKYLTTNVYSPGVYHYTKETVTATKPGETFTCSYHSSSVYPTAQATWYPSATKAGAHASQLPGTNSAGYETPSVATTVASHASTPASSDDNATASPTTPNGPDPSSDYEEAEEPYGSADAGYVKRGGMIERRKGNQLQKRATSRRVILV